MVAEDRNVKQTYTTVTPPRRRPSAVATEDRNLLVCIGKSGPKGEWRPSAMATEDRNKVTPVADPKDGNVAAVSDGGRGPQRQLASLISWRSPVAAVSDGGGGSQQVPPGDRLGQVHVAAVSDGGRGSQRQDRLRPVRLRHSGGRRRRRPRIATGTGRGTSPTRAGWRPSATAAEDRNCTLGGYTWYVSVTWR